MALWLGVETDVLSKEIAFGYSLYKLEGSHIKQMTGLGFNERLIALTLS